MTINEHFDGKGIVPDDAKHDVPQERGSSGFSA